jgi:hypothetical protein
MLTNNTHCIGVKAASSYIARFCGGPPWFEQVSALEDCVRRGMGPPIERVTDGGENVYSNVDLAAWTINTFGGDPKEEMLNLYLGKGSYELVWRSATAETELVDFADVFR